MSAEAVRPRILLADDVESVRDVVSRALREAGYDVTMVEDGWKAWREAQNRPFDLVITDQVMPHMSGTDLIHRLRQANPSLPIIMISGFVTEPDTPSGLPHDIPLVYKPFGGDTIVTEVRRMLS